jgi:hypothetical protein
MPLMNGKIDGQWAIFDFILAASKERRADRACREPITSSPASMAGQEEETRDSTRDPLTLADEGMTPRSSMFAYLVPAKEEARSKDT